MSFLKQVATRSNDQTYILPNSNPTHPAYLKWKNKNYSETLLTGLKTYKTGLACMYSDQPMWQYFKILKRLGLTNETRMARTGSARPVQVEGKYVTIGGYKIYIDSDGFAE